MDVRFSDDPQAFLAELDAYGANLRREIASDAMRRAIGKVGDQFPGAVAHRARLDNA